ncbi:uncharacterized protein C8Q71DRAFT_781795, partial [Rhodofomes roseus]
MYLKVRASIAHAHHPVITTMNTRKYARVFLTSSVAAFRLSTHCAVTVAVASRHPTSTSWTSFVTVLRVLSLCLVSTSASCFNSVAIMLMSSVIASSAFSTGATSGAMST